MPRKFGARSVPTDVCRAIYDAVMNGVRPCVLVRYYQMPRSTVSNIFKRYSTRFGVSGASIARRGRPKKLTTNDLIRLESILVHNRFLPLCTIKSLFNASGTVSVGMRTLRRYARIVGFRNCSAVRKPFIREANLAKRTAWAVRHY